MLRIALGQMEVTPGRPDLNTRRMFEMIKRAQREEAHLIIFPEMSIPGYLVGDSWEQKAFLRDCEEYGRQIIAASADGLCIMFGNVGVDWDKTGDDGRVRKYNAFFTAKDGVLYGGENYPYPFRIKTLQPNYREFDDTRHFFSLQKLSLDLGKDIYELLKPVNVTLKGEMLKVGCILCEDGWSDDYVVKPIAGINSNGPVDLFVNISSSPFTLGKNNKRNRVFSRQVRDCGAPLIYVNCVGVQNNGKTVYTFDGYSTIYNRKGEITGYCDPFKAQLKTVDIDFAGIDNLPAVNVPDDRDVDSIYMALEYGIGKFTSQVGIDKVVVGLSGGIDSAVSACMFTNVLGRKNVLLANMPGKYTSRTTENLAAAVARNLGCHYTVVPIQEVVDFTVEQISRIQIVNQRDNSVSNLDITPLIAENIQARDRSARVLAVLAASFGGAFTCNANKSEMTVGYTTFYGDLGGFLAILADLWKHQVYELAGYLNRCIYKSEVIPQGVIDLVSSAELSPEQAVDEGKGDPIIYPYHDFLFRSFIERWDRSAPEDILNWYIQGVLEEEIGCQPGLVKKLFNSPGEFIDDLERWWKLFTGVAVAKRIQAPPVMAVSRRVYGFDYREAQNQVYFTSGYLKLKNKILKDN